MPERLFDLNIRLLQYVLKQIGLKTDIHLTETFEKTPSDLVDFRQSIQPKPRLNKPDENFVPVPYQQVFQERYGFLPNLSIIDLLFNEGPNALTNHSVKPEEVKMLMPICQLLILQLRHNVYLFGPAS